MDSVGLVIPPRPSPSEAHSSSASSHQPCTESRYGPYRVVSLKLEESHILQKRNLSPSYWHSYVPPRMFQLTVNYRSHAGIINCAQTVVDLLTALWPESIDRLSPDRGWRMGPKPKFVRRRGFQELFQFTSNDNIDVR